MSSIAFKYDLVHQRVIYTYISEVICLQSLSIDYKNINVH